MRSAKYLMITVQIFVFCWSQTTYRTGSALAQTRVSVRATKPPVPKSKILKIGNFFPVANTY